MEGEQEAVTFVLKIDENGRHIYTLHPTGERYELDEETREMIEIQGEDEREAVVDCPPVKRIKLEQIDTDDSFEEEEVGAVITELEEDEEEEEVEQEVLTTENCITEVHTPVAITVAKPKKRTNLSSLEGTTITQHMDIQAPLSMLRSLLERRFHVKLDGYAFWLQDKQILESHRTLVEQCVQGEGLVQVNLQVKTVGLSKRINIEDVLKPAEEYPALLDESLQLDEDDDSEGQPTVEDAANPIVRWIVDHQFKRDAERLKIPTDPFDWTVAHVRHWLQWAVRQFNLVGLRLSDWQITGRELCQLSLSDFKFKVKRDPGDIFWTHLELLRKCKFVAVVQTRDLSKGPAGGGGMQPLTPTSTRGRGGRAARVIGRAANKLSRVIGMPISAEYQTGTVAFGSQVGNRTGNNGQVQLWQFLLELLTDKEHRHVIQWIGNEGEFKLVNPEMVAQLWGVRKNKPTMNYEKLSRALRYYYDGDMISKVHGKRFVYKYVCDLRQLIGYSPNELNRLCAEAAVSNNIILPIDELNYEEC